MICASFAFGPITARFFIVGSNGRRLLFFNKTIPSAAAFLNNFLCSLLSLLSSALMPGFSNLLENEATVKILLTLSLISSSSTFLLRTALHNCSPQTFPGPGISRSKPPLAFSSVSSAAPQSLTT